jgi:PIN domain nuclease of toxin-antitoxin system
VRLLLDSHVFLWWKMSDPRLPSTVVEAVVEAREAWVSAATAWELGLKASLGKLRLPEPVEDGILAAGFTELPVCFRHTRRAMTLPLHHRDPFDRILVAQALCEGLTLVTHDEAIARYEVPILRVP